MLLSLRQFRFLALILLCFGAGQTVAQSLKPVPALVQRYRDAGAAFEPVQPFQPAGVLDEDAARFAPQGQFLTLDKTVLQAIYTQRPQTLAITLPYHQETITIDLVEEDVLTDDFSVVTSTSDGLPVAVDRSVHYRGVVRGNDQSIAAFSFFDGDVMGLFSEQFGGNMVIGRLETPGNTLGYMLYSDAEVTATNSFTCGTEDGELDAHKPAGEPGAESVVGGCVRLYWEGDYALFVNKGSVQGAVNYLSGVFNQMTTLYANEQITIFLQQCFIWTTPDTYSTSSSSTALSQFRSFRTQFNGNMAHLVGIAGNNLGGVAYLNVICSTSNRYAYSDINTSFNNVPTYSWTVMVVTHETGHNLGSNHTQWCGWVGGALDNCYTTEGGCAPGPPPTNGGTIMSYCHLTSNGINLANGFGQQPGNKIRTQVVAATCLQTSCTASGSCTPPTNLNVSVAGTTATVTWSAAGGATSYTLQYRIAGNGSLNTVSNVTSPYTLNGLNANTNYDVTVRTNCGTVSSEYASGAIFKTGAAASCGAPAGLTAAATSTTTATASWNAVSGATSYQVSWKLASSSTWGGAVSVTTTSYNITGLAANSAYNVRVLAVCSSGNSTYSTANFSTPASGTCLAPTGLTAVASSASAATATWTAVPGATSYRVSYKPTSSSTWTSEATVTTTSYNITGLSPSTSYDVRVRTVCSVGTSAYTQTSFTTPAAATCTAVTGLAVAPSNTSAVVTWTANPNAVTYQVSWKTASSSTWGAAVNVTAPTHTITGLQAGTAYNVRVLTQCSFGSSTYTTANFTTTTTSTCGAVTGLTATPTSTTTAAVTWSPAAGATSYQISWKRTTTSGWGNAVTVTGTSYTITGLLANTSYDVRVRTICGSSNSQFTQTVFTTPATAVCTPPTGLVAEATAATSGTATWTAAAGVTQYRISWKRTTLSTWSSPVTVNGTTYDINNLTANTGYDVRVQSYCSATSSSTYIQTSFTTPSSLPGGGGSPSALEAPAQVLELTVLPNPTTGYVAVAISRTSPEMVIDVIDRYGKVLRTEHPGDNHRIEFDVTDLPSGLYLVRASDGRGAVTVQKVVKQ